MTLKPVFIVIALGLATVIAVVVAVPWVMGEFARATILDGAASNVTIIEKSYEISLRYRVGGEEVAGSGVIRSLFETLTDGSGQHAQVSSYAFADAIPMHTSDGRVLVALLATTDEARRSLGYLLTENCGIAPSVADGTGASWLKSVAELDAECSVSPALLPILLMFPSPASPEGATYIAADDHRSDVTFVSGSLRTTEAPPTTQIVSALPWVRNFRGTVTLANAVEAPRWVRQIGLPATSFIWRSE